MASAIAAWRESLARSARISRHAARAAATSGRFCSAAQSVFSFCRSFYLI
jgi:hypothetical protein